MESLDRAYPCFLISALSGIALLLRLPMFLSRPFWFDEVYQLEVCAAPTLGELIARLQVSERNPPICYLLIWWTSKVVGLNEWSLRLPSLVLGVASVPLAWCVGRRWFGRVCGLAMAILFVASPAFVFYSREGRAYAGAVFAALVLLWTVGNYRWRPSAANAAWLSAASILCLCWQYFTGVVVAGGLLAALYGTWATGRLDRPAFLRWLFASLAILPILPVLVFGLIVHQVHVHGTGIDDFGAYRFTLAEPVVAARKLLSHSMELWEYFLQAAPLGPRWSLVGLLLVLPALFSVCLAARHSWRHRMVLLLGFISVLLAITLAGLALHPYGGLRHCLALAPVLFLIAAAGVGRLSRSWPWIASGVLVGLVCHMAYGQWMVLPIKHVHDFRCLLKDLAPQVQEGDALLIAGEGATVVLGHYRDTDPLLRSAQYFPTSEGRLVGPTAVFREAVERELGLGHRVWVIEFALERQGVEPVLTGGWTERETVACQGIRATLWVPKKR